MTLNDLIRRLDNVLQGIERDGERQVAIAGGDIAALGTKRVIEQGKTADGGRFTPYSRKQIPAFFYVGKSRRGSADNEVKRKARKKETLSYSDFRQLNGLNVTFKNFEFTGSMWRNFRVLKVQRTGYKFTAVLGGAVPLEQNKINWLSAQEGRSIIEPSEAELKVVTDNLNKWLNGLFNG